MQDKNNTPPGHDSVLYTYRLSGAKTAENYNEAVAAACLQGLLNREAPLLYVLSAQDDRPQQWLHIFTMQGQWLAERPQEALPDLL